MAKPALVQDASALCLGRIGLGGNMCLKLIVDRDTEKGHKRANKCGIDANDPETSFIDALFQHSTPLVDLA